MDNLFNNFLVLIKILAATIGLFASSLLQGNFPTLNSLEAVWQGTQPPQITTGMNDNSSSNSNTQNTNDPTVRHGQGERIAQGLRGLPSIQITTGQIVVKNVSISAGDRAVSSMRLTKASQIIKDISLPTLSSLVGLSPAKNIQVVLFSSSKTYANALREAGIDPKSIPLLVANTGGLTVGTTIWIPLFNLKDNSDFANSLSHELFHACASSQGYDAQLPIWMNEGTAWRIGLMAMKQINPQKTALEMDSLEVGVRNAAKNGTLLPLTTSEDGILSAKYNVEYEDFMAVEQLVKKYGTSTYKNFITNLKYENVRKDFQNTFNTTIDNYQSSFIKSLKEN